MKRIICLSLCAICLVSLMGCTTKKPAISIKEKPESEPVASEEQVERHTETQKSENETKQEKIPASKFISARIIDKTVVDDDTFAIKATKAYETETSYLFEFDITGKEFHTLSVFSSVGTALGIVTGQSVNNVVGKFGDLIFSGEEEQEPSNHCLICVEYTRADLASIGISSFEEIEKIAFDLEMEDMDNENPLVGRAHVVLETGNENTLNNITESCSLVASNPYFDFYSLDKVFTDGYAINNDGYMNSEHAGFKFLLKPKFTENQIVSNTYRLTIGYGDRDYSVEDLRMGAIDKEYEDGQQYFNAGIAYFTGYFNYPQPMDQDSLFLITVIPHDTECLVLEDEHFVSKNILFDFNKPGFISLLLDTEVRDGNRESERYGKYISAESSVVKLPIPTMSNS